MRDEQICEQWEGGGVKTNTSVTVTVSFNQPVWPRKPDVEGNDPECKHQWLHCSAVMGTMQWRDCNLCGAEMWPKAWKKPSKAFLKKKWSRIGVFGGGD